MTIRTEVLMGTVVTVHVVGSGAEAAVERAFGWIRQVEDTCTRFDDRSELMRLTSQVGFPVSASAILFGAVQFALQVAEQSGGAFDPTVGGRMEARGFNREHRTGRIIRTGIASDSGVSYRDVSVDPASRSITLLRPLVLDLGAVAKGLAVDAAARELQPFEDFAIDAGGDLYLGGCNTAGAKWSIGIRHPRIEGQLIDTLHVSNMAVCTSGDYERRTSAKETEHHILDPRTGASPGTIVSATVVAPSAMLADTLSTAVFVMQPEEGVLFLDRFGVQGLLVTNDLERYETQGLHRV